MLDETLATIGEVAVPPVDCAICSRLGPFAILLPNAEQAAALGRERQLGPILGLGGKRERGLLSALLNEKPQCLRKVDNHVDIGCAVLQVVRVEKRVVDTLGNPLGNAAVLQG